MNELNKIDVYSSVKSYKKRYDSFKKSTRFREDNKKLVLKFIDQKKKMLENQDGYSHVANIRHAKTLLKNFSYLTNILHWFNDKCLNDLTASDIKKVYEALEKGELKSIMNRQISKGSLKYYYATYFKGEFFKYLKKDKISKKVILRRIDQPKIPRFFTLQDLHNLITVAQKIEHKLFMWLAFDTGVECLALLNTVKSDFVKEINVDGRDWIFHVRKEIAKKHRQPRHLYLYFEETKKLLDLYLDLLEPNQKLFDWIPRTVSNFLKRYSDQTKLKVRPNNTYLRIKDFRSSMATYFLVELSWSTDDVKARLGHSPSSDAIDHYVSYFGLNQKRKIRESKELTFNNYQKEHQRLIDQVSHLKHNYDLLTTKLKEMEQIIDYDKLNYLVDSMKKT